MVHRNGLCRTTYTYKNKKILKLPYCTIPIIPITILFGKYMLLNCLNHYLLEPRVGMILIF